MSRIEINQLNTSEFNELNINETADVVGGKGWWGKKKVYYGGDKFKNSFNKYFDIDVKQENYNYTEQNVVNFGGGKFSKNKASAYNKTKQSNNISGFSIG